MKVLVVEDDHTIAQALKDGLVQETFAVDIAYNGEDGYSSACEDEYDLIILDNMLPGKSGLEIAAQLRTNANHTRILMLSAKDQLPDKIRGLNMGADDYMVKPFSFEELLARVKALLRRPHEKHAEILTAGQLSLNTITREVVRDSKAIILSAKEYAILEYLLRNKGKVLSKHSIITHVWDFDADILPHTVEAFMAYLRAKIDKPFKDAPLIKTVRGFGYKIEAV
jgi:two-component system, OmpR family, response regulator